MIFILFINNVRGVPGEIILIIYCSGKTIDDVITLKSPRSYDHVKIQSIFFISHKLTRIIFKWFSIITWGQSWRRGRKCDCKIDCLWVRSPLEEVKYLFTFISSFRRSGVKQSAALSSATQHTMPSELGGKWGTECLNTRFPLPTLLCARYSVKLIHVSRQ